MTSADSWPRPARSEVMSARGIRSEDAERPPPGLYRRRRCPRARWLAASAEVKPDPVPPAGRSCVTSGPRLHARLRRPGRPPRGPPGRRPAPRADQPGRPRRARLVPPRRGDARRWLRDDGPVGRHPHRPPDPAPDDRAPGRRRSTAKLGPASPRSAAGGPVLDVHLLGEAVLGSAESDRRLQGTWTCSPATTSTACRSGLGTVVPEMSLVGVRPDGRARRRPTRPAVPAGGVPRARRPEVHHARHRGPPRPRRHRRGVPGPCSTATSSSGCTPASCCRPHLPDTAGVLESLPSGPPPVAPAAAHRSPSGWSRARPWRSSASTPCCTTGRSRRGAATETDTASLRLLDAALTPERTDAVQIGVARHDLFTWPPRGCSPDAAG